MYVPIGLKIASILLHVGLIERIWAQLEPKLAQAGPMLDPSWLKLASSWGHVGAIGGSLAAPGPTQALPDAFLVASWPPKPPLASYKTQNRCQKGLPNIQFGP